MDNYQDPEKLTEAMKSGLARMYADEDIRAYLLHMINVYNHNVLVSLRSNATDTAKDYTAKFDTMKKLLDNSKLMFSQAEKLKAKPLQELIKEKDYEENK